jgi:hypothetical protein
MFDDFDLYDPPEPPESCFGCMEHGRYNCPTHGEEPADEEDKEEN